MAWTFRQPSSRSDQAHDSAGGALDVLPVVNQAEAAPSGARVLTAGDLLIQSSSRTTPIASVINWDSGSDRIRARATETAVSMRR